MTCNVGGIDMTIRLAIGLIFLAIGLAIPMAAALKVIVFVIAAIGFITGFVRYCPINALVGLNTCAGQRRRPQILTK